MNELKKIMLPYWAKIKYWAICAGAFYLAVLFSEKIATVLFYTCVAVLALLTLLSICHAITHIAGILFKKTFGKQ